MNFNNLNDIMAEVPVLDLPLKASIFFVFSGGFAASGLLFTLIYFVVPNVLNMTVVNAVIALFTTAIAYAVGGLVVRLSGEEDK